MPFDMTVSNLDWTAEIRPIYDGSGREIPANIARGVYRGETILATCGAHTKLIQHTDVLDPVLQALHDEGVEIREREWGRHDLYDLKGQKGAFVATQLDKDGAVMRTRVITGDFIEPTGPSAFLPSGPPTLFKMFDILNSHDSTYSAQVDLKYMNILCMNGLVREDFAARVRSKHTLNFSMDAFRDKVRASAELMLRDVERFKLYVRTSLTREEAEAFFKATIAKLKDKPTGEPNWSDRLVAKLLELFDSEPQSVWGAYQAMTAWATHGDLREGDSPLTARVGREERVARAMRADEFRELLAA